MIPDASVGSRPLVVNGDSLIWTVADKDEENAVPHGNSTRLCSPLICWVFKTKS